MGAESFVGLVPFSTRAVIWMSSVWQAGTSIWVRASGRVTEQPEPGADLAVPEVLDVHVAARQRLEGDARRAFPEVDIWIWIGPRFDGKSE